MKTTKEVLGGLVAGLSAGALLGVLIAPEKGSETRRKIIDKSGKFTKALKDKFNDSVNGFKQKDESSVQQADFHFAKHKKKPEKHKKNVEATAM